MCLLVVILEEWVQCFTGPRRIPLTEKCFTVYTSVVVKSNNFLIQFQLNRNKGVGGSAYYTYANTDFCVEGC